MSEKMLYILGVPTEDDKTIRDNDKYKRLGTSVETYVGVHSTKMVSNIINVTDDMQSTWLNALTEIYNNGIKYNDLLTHFYAKTDSNLALKTNTFLLRMIYSGDVESQIYSAENIEIIFFDSEGKQLELVKINIVDNQIADDVIVPIELPVTSKTIKALIEELTGIDIKDSEKVDAKLVGTTRMGATIPQGSPNYVKPLNKLKVVGSEGGSSHKTRKGKRNNTKNNKKGGSKTKRKSSKKRVNKK